MKSKVKIMAAEKAPDEKIPWEELEVGDFYDPGSCYGPLCVKVCEKMFFSFSRNQCCYPSTRGWLCIRLDVGIKYRKAG